MAKIPKVEAKGGEVLGADQISALNTALISAKSEGQDIGKLSVAEITSLLTLHANSVKVAEAAIPKKFKLLKNHGLVANGKTSTFYEAGTVFDSIEHRDLIGTLVRDGAEVEEVAAEPQAETQSE